MALTFRALSCMARIFYPSLALLAYALFSWTCLALPCLV
ncbi:putative membrane protein [Chlamydia psittaci 10_743_SC13]|nr:putative membrane protein [Chlamydia psittaci 10_743_SC13]